MIQYSINRTGIDRDCVSRILLGTARWPRADAKVPDDIMRLVEEQWRSGQVRWMVLDRDTAAGCGLPGDRQISRRRLYLFQQLDCSRYAKYAGARTRGHHAFT